jgi:hypothetical protein
MSPPPGDDWDKWNPYEAHPTDRIVQYTEDCGRLVKERLEQDGVAIIKVSATLLSSFLKYNISVVHKYVTKP